MLAVETPIGGPLAEPAAAQSEADRAGAKAERAKKLAAARKARADAHRTSTQDRGGAGRAGARETAGRDVVTQQWFLKSGLWKFRLRKHVRETVDRGAATKADQRSATCRAKPGADLSTNSAPIS